MVVVQVHAGEIFDEFGRIIARQLLALVEDIDQLWLTLSRHMPHHEMPWQTDAFDVQTQLATKFHVQNRQCDGQPFAIVDHAMQVAVGGVIVLGAAAMKALLLVKVSIEGNQLFGFGRVILERLAKVICHALDDRFISRHVDIFIVQTGQEAIARECR